jgi:TIR domain
MLRRRIFVSHSNSDPDSPAYIEAIDSALAAAGFEMLVDRKRLEPGAKWRDDIYTWMGLCHGAVILISEAAIRPGSIWVPRETNILLWRRTLDPNFVVIPVCLGVVRPEDLKSGVFTDMQLGEIETAPAATTAELVGALSARFARLAAPRTPLELLASRVAEVLLAVSDNAIEEAIEQLPIDLGPCRATLDSRQALGLALLQIPLRKSVAALEILAEYVEGSKADQILAIIAPSWVDLCAARWVADCGGRIDDKPAAVLNAATLFCARMYVDRASCRPPKTRWPLVNTTGVHGERVAQEIAAEVEQNLIQEFRLADDPQMPEPRARLAALLRERQREGRPVFATLQCSAAIAAELSELQRLLPSVTFILLSGDEFPAPAILDGKRVRFVEPRLAPGAEAQAQLDFDFVRSIIRPQGAAGV